jgi:hypothetical protein
MFSLRQATQDRNLPERNGDRDAQQGIDAPQPGTDGGFTSN